VLLQGGGKAAGADALAGVPPYAQRLRPVASADAERVAESSAKKNTQGGVTGMRSAASATAATLEGKVDPNADGMEHLGAARRQRRFGRDLRLKEVRSLLTSTTSAVVRLPASAAEVSDPEAIAAAQVPSTPKRPSQGLAAAAFVLTYIKRERERWWCTQRDSRKSDWVSLPAQGGGNKLEQTLGV